MEKTVSRKNTSCCARLENEEKHERRRRSTKDIEVRITRNPVSSTNPPSFIIFSPLLKFDS